MYLVLRSFLDGSISHTCCFCRICRAVGKKNKKNLREWIIKKKHAHMWQMHLNMRLSKILACILCAFILECTSKCYHNERKYCSYYSATSCRHWGDLHKVVQSDIFKKITLHSEKLNGLVVRSYLTRKYK